MGSSEATRAGPRGDAVYVSGPFTAELCSRDGTPPRVSFPIIADRIASPRLGKRKEAAL
jgi:hypothetical protein